LLKFPKIYNPSCQE